MVTVAYFDTSALLKRYVREPGSDWISSFLAENTKMSVLTSCLTTVEAACAFARRRREGVLTAETHETIEVAFRYDVDYRC